MVKKGIIILVIFLITISAGIYELISVKRTLTSMEDVVTDLTYRYGQNEDDIRVFYDEIGDLKETWEERENWLCFLFNHRDLSTITDCINRLIAFTSNNDYDNAICELSLLKEYSTKSHHIMGFNIHNIL